MEIEITNMVEDSDHMPMLSGSRFELGDNAGSITWNNSKDYASKHPLLTTPEQIAEARDYFREFGAWEDAEIDAWSVEDVQAITVQEIACQIRKMEPYETYEEYQAASEAGQISGSIFKSNDRWYFYMGF